MDEFQKWWDETYGQILTITNDPYADASCRIAKITALDAWKAGIAALEAERDALRADAALYAGTVRIEYNDVYVAACRRQGVGPDSFDVYLEKCRAIDRAAIAAKGVQS